MVLDVLPLRGMGMSWYTDADNSKELNYAPPKVTPQNLDAGGNYVSPAPKSAGGAASASSSSPGGPGTLGNTIIE
jgi:hypothetical protein